MRSSQFRYAMAGALLSYAAAAAGQPHVAVVELFTSQGCSSCPPAETYIGELAQRTGVLALAFHVGYWDDLGWKDRFGLAIADQRQQAYARALGLSSIYTPQVVLDGRNDFVGSDRISIDRGLQRSRTGVPVAISIQGGEAVIDVDAQARAAPSDVVLVAYQRSAVSAIGRGENSGRTLTEFNIVRALQNLGRWDGGAQHYHAPLESLPVDATDVAVLVQAVGQGPIAGAATARIHGP